MEGELLLTASSRQARSYRLTAGMEIPAAAWQQRLPVPAELSLPNRALPRLQALADLWRALPSDQERLQAAEQWFRSQPFRYSLEPGASADLEDFLFDRQVGFCGHYAGALAALDDDEHVARSRQANAQGMSFLRRELEAMGIRTWDSDANFVLAETGEGTYEGLLPLGVIVRPMAGFGLTDCVRITVGTQAENQRVVESLRELRSSRS